MTSNAVIAIHGGAGTISLASMTPDVEARYHAELRAVLDAAQRVLADGGSALEPPSVRPRGQYSLRPFACVCGSVSKP